MLFSSVLYLVLQSLVGMWLAVLIVASGGVRNGTGQLATTVVTAVGNVSAGFGFIRSSGRNTSIGKEAVVISRRSELPPKWDGLRVDWRGFELEPVSFDVLADCCASCGGVGPRSINHGCLPDAEVPSHLVAVRCAACGFTQVRDAKRVWWDLDESDYLDEGSVYKKQGELTI